MLIRTCTNSSNASFIASPNEQPSRYIPHPEAAACEVKK